MNYHVTTTRKLFCAGIFCLILASCGLNNGSSSAGQDNLGGSDTTNQQSSAGQQAQSNSQNQDQQEGEPDVEEIERSWQNSPHASTFLVDEEGNNNSCAQCHAPLDWQPSMDTIPETCFTCKFELEDPPPFIPEENWQDIPCNVCHQLDRRDQVQADYAWLAIAAIDEYEEVSSTTELCQKCHLSAEPVEGHRAVEVTEVHQDQTCTDCHNAHDTSAACLSCHETMDDTLVGHDEDHAAIACVLCHEGSQLAAGFNDQTTEWYLVDPEIDLTSPVRSSHNILLEATCSRCHYADNPWQLSIQQ